MISLATLSVEITEKNCPLGANLIYLHSSSKKTSARHGADSIDAKVEEHPHSRKYQCNVSYQTSESTKMMNFLHDKGTQ